MSVEQCVIEVLCGLSAATLAQFKVYLDGQVTLLRLQIDVLEAKILKYDVAFLPVSITSAFAQKALAEMQALASLVPLSLAGDCVGLGTLSLDVEANLRAVSAELEDQARDLIRLLSVKKDLRARIAQIQGIISYYEEILEAIRVCASGGNVVVA